MYNKIHFPTRKYIEVEDCSTFSTQNGGDRHKKITYTHTHTSLKNQ